MRVGTGATIGVSDMVEMGVKVGVAVKLVTLVGKSVEFGPTIRWLHLIDKTKKIHIKSVEIMKRIIIISLDCVYYIAIVKSKYGSEQKNWLTAIMTCKVCLFSLHKSGLRQPQSSCYFRNTIGYNLAQHRYCILAGGHWSDGHSYCCRQKTHTAPG